MEECYRWRRDDRKAASSSSVSIDAWDLDRLRAVCADLNVKLRREVEAKQQLQRLRARDKERFKEEFGQFEARLIRANETLEKNRQIVEASLVEKDKIIEQLQQQVDRKQHTIECLKQDPRLLYSSRHRQRQAQDPSFDHLDGDRNDDPNANIHELERQISKLYGELNEARQVQQAQNDQIEGMKAASAKLVASLKKMKFKVKEAANTAENHMVHDMTRKCMRLEAEKATIETTLQTTQAKLVECKAVVKDLTERLTTATERIVALEGDVSARIAAEGAMEKQWRRQQHYIQDLEIDFKTIGRVDVNNPEMEHAQRTLASKTEKLMKLEKRLQRYERDIAGLRETQGDGVVVLDPQRKALSLVDLDYVLAQVRMAVS
ncbi:hypothetical protein, variant [Aphanomyces invadans]|uniref:Uncharacterized protein n=1 Tax=Aphanomyces invadans TaxID=157072 RepID=A0A024U426_9STRA|nr:hypothetical protein, variant [Aphanomyces invadans]ETW00960.1 hypothetical protein, variant [Aphanomyces invadans]|eukprot:XP_008869958.1 hypothetical protein, variant [Aphanomyces invadans]